MEQVSSSPLRRKSIMMRQSKFALLSVNDDEAERLARRRETISSPTIAVNAADRRRSLGLSILNNMSSSEMVEGVSQCIKLGAENKINIKNAFSLKMIDFMTYMITKRDSNMADLQMASMSLDVSTKIYGFRVDGIYMEILKIVGALDKQEPKDTEKIDEDNEVQTKKKTKKKRVKQLILTTEESLRTNVQTAKPVLPSMESDLETSDKLLQVTLPHHAGSGFYPHRYNEILLDTVAHKETRDTDIGHSIPIIKDISKMKICPPTFYFDFQNFDANDEPEDVEPEDDEPEKMNENAFLFDLNAPLQDTRQSYSGIHYSDNEDNEEENVERCVNLLNEVENIVEFQQLMGSSSVRKPSEYSVVQQTFHWRGPSYWNPSNTRKLLENDQKCYQARIKKKKEFKLHYNFETQERLKDNFLPNKAVKIKSRTAKMEWSERILTLPEDKHYDIRQASQLYIHPITFEPPKNTDEMNTTHLSDIVNNDDYNYENNISYCPQTNDNEYQKTKDSNAILDGAVSTNDYVEPTQSLIGSNLVAVPSLPNKINIPHCIRAKKIDMKVLKQTIWKSLCTDSDQNVMEVDTRSNECLQNSDQMNGTKNFIEIHKTLPTLLTKNNAEALSLPISFVSLLHLANEKSLKITSSPDTNEIIVQQD